jgi:hypothetical protein
MKGFLKFYLKLTGGLCDLILLTIIFNEASSQSGHSRKNNVVTKCANFLIGHGRVEEGTWGGWRGLQNIGEMSKGTDIVFVQKHDPKQNVLQNVKF